MKLKDITQNKVVLAEINQRLLDSSGKLIPVIKHLRQRTGCGLRVAVEALRHRARQLNVRINLNNRGGDTAKELVNRIKAMTQQELERLAALDLNETVKAALESLSDKED